MREWRGGEGRERRGKGGRGEGEESEGRGEEREALSLLCCIAYSPLSPPNEPLEVITSSDGTRISPVLIENTIKKEIPFLNHVVVIGDQRHYLICLVTIKVCCTTLAIGYVHTYQVGYRYVFGYFYFPVEA